MGAVVVTHPPLFNSAQPRQGCYHGRIIVQHAGGAGTCWALIYSTQSFDCLRKNYTRYISAWRTTKKKKHDIMAETSVECSMIVVGPHAPYESSVAANASPEGPRCSRCAPPGRRPKTVTENKRSDGGCKSRGEHR